MKDKLKLQFLPKIKSKIVILNSVA